MDRAAYAKGWRKAHPTYYKERRPASVRRLNKRLRLTNTYSRMLQRVQGKCTNRAREYYVNLTILPREQFLEWAEKDGSFNQLFDAWIASGFQRNLTPSIDRINPEIGYELGNMRWVTLAENSKYTRRTRHWQKQF